MYAKVFASLYQGTLRGCADEILVFTNLLAFADATGVVDKHFRSIADETGISEERVRAAIAVLEAPDPESRSRELEGRRLIPMDDHRAWGWMIVNHGKYRDIRNEADRREQNRLAQARYRERQQASGEVSNSNQDCLRVLTNKQSKPIQKQKQKHIQITEEEREEGETPSPPPEEPIYDSALFDYPVRELVEAFPQINFQPTHFGFIESEIGNTPTDRAAWLATIQIYQQNHDARNNVYMPTKVGNLLGVFRRERTRIEREEKYATNKTESRNTTAAKEWLALEQAAS